MNKEERTMKWIPLIALLAGCGSVDATDYDVDGLEDILDTSNDDTTDDTTDDTDNSTETETAADADADADADTDADDDAVGPDADDVAPDIAPPFAEECIMALNALRAAEGLSVIERSFELEPCANIAAQYGYEHGRLYANSPDDGCLVDFNVTYYGWSWPITCDSGRLPCPPAGCFDDWLQDMWDGGFSAPMGSDVCATWLRIDSSYNIVVGSCAQYSGPAGTWFTIAITQRPPHT